MGIDAPHRATAMLSTHVIIRQRPLSPAYTRARALLGPCWSPVRIAHSALAWAVVDDGRERDHGSVEPWRTAVGTYVQYLRTVQAGRLDVTRESASVVLYLCLFHGCLTGVSVCVDRSVSVTGLRFDKARY